MSYSLNPVCPKYVLNWRVFRKIEVQIFEVLLYMISLFCYDDIYLILRERRLRWFGHVERSSGAIRTAYDMQFDGKRGTGRPKQTWKKLTEKDCSEWKLTTVDPQERSTWRSGVRSAMRAASQLPGKGPTDVDDAPAPAGKSKIRL